MDMEVPPGCSVLGTTGEQYFNWTVQLYGSSLDISPVYFFWINYDWGSQMTSPLNRSAPQHLVQPRGNYSSATPTPTQNANVTSEETGSAASDDSSKLALKVGLGLGIGLGVPLVPIAGFWLGRRRKRDPPVALSPNIEQSEGKLVAPMPAEPPNYQVPDPNAVYEMQGPEDVAKDGNRQSLREME
ncbi:hypothetical protein AC579_4664 [Pseudocercospora musae]|uniref:Mid2 domain-containing protein n=1 Tax=Pseudocercospora musae TaxID=113226 RepID=A0A139IBQ0_9PEZI|nr:hypothetical protein AC579_4664 [Pseudocercospora musae]